MSHARDRASTVAGSTVAPATWWKRENVLPVLILLLATAVAWAYALRAPMHAHTMPGMRMPLGLFLFGWAAMMVAMMLPATLPLILLYRGMAARRSRGEAISGMVFLIAGYFAVWTAAGLPVYAYSQLVTGPVKSVLPALLLIAGGLYQFTSVKHACHSRCSSPFFFLMRQWRPGASGAARLGALHGIDCLGCCLGLMLGLIALGMMNAAWMLAATVIIVAEKTLPRAHVIARPLGVAMIVGGIALAAAGFS